MSRVTRRRGISISLWEFKSRYILPHRGEKARLKRQCHRLDRQMAKDELRHFTLKEWTEGDFEIPAIIPTSLSHMGDSIYLGGQ